MIRSRFFLQKAYIKRRKGDSRTCAKAALIVAYEEAI